MKIPAILMLSAISVLEVMPFFNNVALAQRNPSYSNSYCESYARDYARQKSRGGALRGAMGAAATGALIGVIVDGGRGAGKGAAIGSAVGAIGGGARRVNSYDRLYSATHKSKGKSQKSKVCCARVSEITNVLTVFCTAI